MSAPKPKGTVSLPARRGRPDLTQGPILRALLTLALPIVGANVLQSLYQLTDTFWVGQLGAAAVAAVSLSFPVIFLLIALGGGVAVAGAILVAQSFGAGNSRLVDHVAAQTLMAVIAASILLSLIGYSTAGPLMRVFGAAPDVLQNATAYLKISFLGLIFLFVYFVFQSLMRGVGDVRTPFYIVLGTVALNFAADPLFILGWGIVPPMGVAGAAMATVLTQGLASVIGLHILLKGHYGVRVHLRDLKPDAALMARIFTLGLPASIEQSMRALGLALMTLLVAGFGTTAVASYGIGMRMLSFVIIPALGLSMATTTVVGQNIGAGKSHRAWRTATVAGWLAFGSLSAIGIVFFVLARPITAAFVPHSADVIAAGSLFLRIIALSFGLLGVQLVLAGAFRGAGNTLAAMGLAIISLWILRFPIAYILSERTALGVQGIWWSITLSNLFTAVLALVWLWRGRWPGGRSPEDTQLRERIAREAIVDEGLG